MREDEAEAGEILEFRYFGSLKKSSEKNGLEEDDVFLCFLHSNSSVSRASGCLCSLLETALLFLFCWQQKDCGVKMLRVLTDACGGVTLCCAY